MSEFYCNIQGNQPNPLSSRRISPATLNSGLKNQSKRKRNNVLNAASMRMVKVIYYLWRQPRKLTIAGLFLSQKQKKLALKSRRKSRVNFHHIQIQNYLSAYYLDCISGEPELQSNNSTSISEFTFRDKRRSRPNACFRSHQTHQT